MKKIPLSYIYRFIVGGESGYIGEGNEQWYYTVSLAINLMLLWWLKPEIALTFTILPAIHIVTMFLYEFFEFCEKRAFWSYAYFGIHLILFAIALFTSFKWTLITTAITVVAYLIAPDCVGKNIFLRDDCNIDILISAVSLFFNTLILVAYAIVVFILPIALPFKIVLLILAFLVHFIVDAASGDLFIISDVTEEAFDKIKESINKEST